MRPFPEEIRVEEGEVLLMELNRFEDREHHDRVMELVDAHPRINELYATFSGILGVGRVIRGEFRRAL